MDDGEGQRNEIERILEGLTIAFGGLPIPPEADLIPDMILGLLARPDLTKWWGEREDSIREAFSERGIPERILSDLSMEESPRNEVSCRERVAALSELQRHAVIKFVKFLRASRREEFALDHLDRVEERLQSA